MHHLMSKLMMFLNWKITLFILKVQTCQKDGEGLKFLEKQLESLIPMSKILMVKGSTVRKKIDVFIATNRLKLKDIKFNYAGPSRGKEGPSSGKEGPSSGKEGPSSGKEAKIKSKKQPCRESNNIPSEVSKKPIIPSKKKKDSKELDKENKAEKKQREKKTEN
eukprot:GFUD01067436.1.p1 GENE.GFUD01067436.1~~GFUD01067436.1.p1  ORF type:complete len:163 (-),score=50.29 GFUD01067436.1:223-711(-)